MNDAIPAFEGHPVQATAVKVIGSAPLEDLEDVVLGIDDRVQLVAIYTCVGVHHEVDKNGNITRVQRIKPAEMHLLPFDETNPNDTGVLKAIPQFASGSGQGTSTAPEDGSE